MTLQHPFILTVLQHVSPDRLQKAVNALLAGDLTISVTRQTEAEIRALAKDGTGSEYGVTVTEALTACSCRDSLYHGTACKHTAAVALYVLRSPQPKTEAPTPQFPTFHLMWRDGIVLCGESQASRVQVWPWTTSMLTWPEACQACTAAYNRPQTTVKAA